MIKDSSLSAVGKTIKRLRKEQNLSLQQLALKSKVTAGLISRIENFRTVPSLPVLQQMAIALKSSRSELVYGVKCSDDIPFLLIKNGEWTTEEREDSQGMLYQSIFSASNEADSFKVNMVTLTPEAQRPAVSNDAHEMIHVISGEVTYTFPQTSITLKQGDTLYFDGRSPHSLVNPLTQQTVLLVLYFLSSVK